MSMRAGRLRIVGPPISGAVAAETAATTPGSFAARSTAGSAGRNRSSARVAAATIGNRAASRTFDMPAACRGAGRSQ